MLKRSGREYAGFEYIICHELGHRYEHKNHVPQDFDKADWWTSRYSRAEGESFAELFALSNFKITNAGGSQEILDRFEAVMTGHEEDDDAPKPMSPQKVRELTKIKVALEDLLGGDEWDRVSLETIDSWFGGRSPEDAVEFALNDSISLDFLIEQSES